MNFADTNWLSALYITPAESDAEGSRREAVVRRFMRRHGGRLLISHLTWLECQNVFRRITGQPDPEELRRLESDFDGAIFVDTMNWDLLRRESQALFEKYAHKTRVGTFDGAMVAAAKLAGARQFLSFVWWRTSPGHRTCRTSLET
jgi:hypothetical protein